jgi:hypothetical protein
MNLGQILGNLDGNNVLMFLIDKIAKEKAIEDKKKTKEEAKKGIKIQKLHRNPFFFFPSFFPS